MEQFEIKVKYVKEQRDGTYKRVTESYLLANCETFTEAETLADKVIFNDAKGETLVVSISRRNYQYVLHDEKAEDWYKCTSALTTINPDTDKETVVKNTYLVQADSVEHANERLLEFMGDNLEEMDNLDISGVVRVKIDGVIEDKIADYESEDEEEEEMEMEMETDMVKEKEKQKK